MAKTSSIKTADDNPYQCNKCFHQTFVIDVSGTFTGRAFVSSPTDLDDDDYCAQDEMEIEHGAAELDDIECDGGWECAKCGSKDYTTFEEAQAAKKNVQFSRDKLIEAGVIYTVPAGQVDLFTGKPIGEPYERVNHIKLMQLQESA